MATQYIIAEGRGPGDPCRTVVTSTGLWVGSINKGQAERVVAALKMLDEWETPCAKCGQAGEDKGGEYPCPECGRATMHDPDTSGDDPVNNVYGGVRYDDDGRPYDVAHPVIRRDVSPALPPDYDPPRDAPEEAIRPFDHLP